MFFFKLFDYKLECMKKNIRFMLAIKKQYLEKFLINKPYLLY